jgi:hypothetical protein
VSSTIPISWRKQKSPTAGRSRSTRAADTYLQLGHVLKLQGKTNEAEASYLRAFALDPSIPYPLQELSRLGWSEIQTAELRGLIAFSQPPAQTGEIQWLPATPSGSRSQSLERNIRAIRESDLFDEVYYRANNTDLPAGIDPVSSVGCSGRSQSARVVRRPIL